MQYFCFKLCRRSPSLSATSLHIRFRPPLFCNQLGPIFPNPRIYLNTSKNRLLFLIACPYVSPSLWLLYVQQYEVHFPFLSCYFLIYPE